MDGIDLAAVPKRPRRRPTITLWSQADVPDYLQKAYISEFYRPAGLSLKAALLSALELHNETFNIWSHFLGAIVMVCLGAAFAAGSSSQLGGRSVLHALSGQVLPFQPHSLSGGAVGELDMPDAVHPDGDIDAVLPPPRWPLIVFDFAAATTLLLSAAAHAFACMGLEVSQRLWRLDQIGISLGIAAAYFPSIHFIFHCEPSAVTTQFLAVVCVMAGGCVAVTGCDVLPLRLKRPTRVALYLLLTSASMMPLSYAVQLHWGVCAIRQTIIRIMVTVTLALIGGFMYTTHFPERWFPHRFDLFGHSHTFFHIFIVLTFLSHHYSSMWLWRWWQRTPSCPPLDLCPASTTR